MKWSRQCRRCIYLYIYNMNKKRKRHHHALWFHWQIKGSLSRRGKFSHHRGRFLIAWLEGFRDSEPPSYGSASSPKKKAPYMRDALSDGPKIQNNNHEAAARRFSTNSREVPSVRPTYYGMYSGCWFNVCWRTLSGQHVEKNKISKMTRQRCWVEWLVRRSERSTWAHQLKKARSSSLSLCSLRIDVCEFYSHQVYLYTSISRI